jgi:general L-amino acid transport system permease protein
MEEQGLTTGFGFLGGEAQFDIQFHLIDYHGGMTYGRAYLVGLLNTILVAVLGIVFATVLGVLFGITRLSSNILLSKIAEWYVEIFRNVPLLLQLFFWYFAVLRALPMPKESVHLFDFFILNIKGLYIPEFVWTNFNALFYSLAGSIAFVVLFIIWAKRVQERTGKQYPKFFITSGVLLIIPILSILVGGVELEFNRPELKQISETLYNYEGGSKAIPELIALVFALGIYTSTFIAECVRAGVMGVTKGQKEAAASIGLTPNQILRLVVMPQALRIIIPPTTNQYLNLTKNSSLAAAIAYPDLVLVFAGTALMQTGRAIEIVSITMLSYLTLSISISIFMNWYNKKMALKEK